MAPLRPLQTWIADTGPNLRARAGYARLSDGDPTAGLRLAGFTTEDLAAFDGEVPTDALVMANSLAANGNAEDETFQRGHREKIDEWLARIAGEYAEEIPGLEGHGATVEWAIRTGNDQIARMLGHRLGTPAAIRAQQRPNLPPRAASVRMDLGRPQPLHPAPHGGRRPLGLGRPRRGHHDATRSTPSARAWATRPTRPTRWATSWATLFWAQRR